MSDQTPLVTDPPTPPPMVPQLQHPNCTRDPTLCRIGTKVISSVTVPVSRTYDGYGTMITNDESTMKTENVCSVCGAEWTAERKLSSSDPPVIVTGKAPA